MGDGIQQLIEPHVQDLGGFQVRRLLPHGHRKMVGPFIFFDHMGPAVFPAGQGVDVRPHPHINLATLTYLFEGVLLHRDSLGSEQEIHPGAVNWMTAGKGITHSERTPLATRQQESRLHGIQTWIALPADQEEADPWFHHHPSDTLPHWDLDGTVCKLIAGSVGGHTSPVKTLSPMLYLDSQFQPQGHLTISADYPERALYVAEGQIQINGEDLPSHHLAILNPDQDVEVQAISSARCIVIGGEPIGERFKWWNFVSSRRERIEQAKQDWRAGRFPSVPAETELIPLPDEQSTPWS